MQSNSTTSKIITTKNKKLANNDKLVSASKKLKSWKRDNTKRLPVEIY